MINDMIDQIKQELNMVPIANGYEVQMHHIERAERQLVDLRVYVYRMNHSSGTMPQREAA